MHFDHICPENGKIWKPLWISLLARQREATENGRCSGTNRHNRLRFVLPISSPVTMPIGSFGIMLTYKLFKKELRAETYLNLPQFKFRKLIAKFRCSDHQLRIETGRHQKLEISQRTCGMCKSGKVENEIHFLIECEAYCDLRQTFLGPNLNSILAATQIEYAFINVLTAQDISRQNNFAQFLQQATELRTKTLMSIQPENVYP